MKLMVLNTLQPLFRGPCNVLAYCLNVMAYWVVHLIQNRAVNNVIRNICAITSQNIIYICR